MAGRFFRHLSEWSLLTLGASLIAVGIYFFEFLNHFTTGGVSGLSIILERLFPAVSAATFMLGINVCLLVAAFFVIGRSFGIKTVYCCALISAETFLLESLVGRTAPLTDQPTLEMLFMILLPTLGATILFYFGASSGGTDIVAMIIKKFSPLNISKALFAADFLIVMMLLFCGFGVQTWLFSVLAFIARILLTDTLLKSMNTSKYCTVITPPEHTDALLDYILNTLQKSATVSRDFVGAYRGDRRTVLLTAMKPRQAAQLREFAKSLDGEIFIIVSSTHEITGEGFYDTL